MARETNHIEDWQPVREILLRVFWCYRYLLKTTVLDNQLLSEEQLTLFIASCEAAANHLHPHMSHTAWPTAAVNETPDDPAATLFLREFNELITCVRALEPQLNAELALSRA